MKKIKKQTEIYTVYEKVMRCKAFHKLKTMSPGQRVNIKKSEYESLWAKVIEEYLLEYKHGTFDPETGSFVKITPAYVYFYAEAEMRAVNEANEMLFWANPDKKLFFSVKEE